LKDYLKRVNVTSEDIFPKIIKSYFLTSSVDFPRGYRFNKRMVYDYELEFFIQSNKGAIMLDDKLYEVHDGDISFRRPGQVTQGIMPYNCYLICFDLLGSTGKNSDTYDLGKEQEFQDYYINPILDKLPALYHPPITEKYHSLFDSILNEYIFPGECSALLTRSYLLKLISELYHDANNPLLNDGIPLSPHYHVVKKSINFIHNNLRNDLSLEKISDYVGLSSSHFHRIFTETMHMTPSHYIAKIRLDKARELLAKSTLPITDLALQCGFNNVSYFCYLFKKNFSISPVKFRAKQSYIGK
jgi:AraC-like DNA-binding protein